MGRGKQHGERSRTRERAKCEDPDHASLSGLVSGLRWWPSSRRRAILSHRVVPAISPVAQSLCSLLVAFSPRGGGPERQRRGGRAPDSLRPADDPFAAAFSLPPCGVLSAETD
jgi:hypothetical protein